MTSIPLKTSDISIIIPTLNEEKNIEPLAHNLTSSDGERIIVDGGSTDHTLTSAYQHRFKVFQCRPSRAQQLNLGAQKSHGKILLFLHADTRLPGNFSSAIIDAIDHKGFSVGAFRLAIENPTPAMQFIATCANLRTAFLQLPYGDQAIFAKKELFFQLGMFPDLPIMEDYAFINKARKKERIVLLKEQVLTSARRWQKLGVWRTTCINQLVILGYHLRVPVKKLALFYKR